MHVKNEQREEDELRSDLTRTYNAYIDWTGVQGNNTTALRKKVNEYRSNNSAPQMPHLGHSITSEEWSEIANVPNLVLDGTNNVIIHLGDPKMHSSFCLSAQHSTTEDGLAPMEERIYLGPVSFEVMTWNRLLEERQKNDVGDVCSHIVDAHLEYVETRSGYTQE